MVSEIIWGVSGITATIIVGYIYRQRKRKKKEGLALDPKGEHPLTDPEYLLGIRAKPVAGFNPYYFQRPLDEEIARRLERHENILIIGNPLAGKSRAVFEALKDFNPLPEIIMPGVDEVRDEKFRVPEGIERLDRVIILLDDIHRYAIRDSFAYNLKAYCDKGAMLVATCRKGPEHEALCGKLIDEIRLFKDPIVIEKISSDEAQTVSENIKKQLPKSFDGNIGSIFLPIEAMENRYHAIAAKAPFRDEKLFLEAIKRLYDAGVYREKEIFAVGHIKPVWAHLREVNDDGKWQSAMSSLVDKGFLDPMGESEIRIEEVYLQRIVFWQYDTVAEFTRLSELLGGDYDALFNIANRAYELGEMSLEKAAYNRLAIAVWEDCLRLRPLEKYQEDYATTQNNLGNAFSTLAEVEDVPQNCRNAIAAYTEALKVYKLDRFPMQYTITQNNLGTAYRTLAEVEDKAENCRNAIATYTEALKVSNLDRLPKVYALTQNNLGNAFHTMAQVGDTVDNCRKAIAAFTEALKVTNLYRFPMDYAMTQNNLGAAYCTLSEVEVETTNCRNGITAFSEALKVYTLDRFPMQYAMTQNNLGAAYRRLAVVEDKALNSQKAIAFCAESLKVYTFNRFPMDYAMIQNNLGAAYRTLAEVEEKTVNCRKAIWSYTEALKVYTLDLFPMQYAMTQYNSAVLYITMASESDKPGNCQKARDALHEALRIFTPDKLPQYNAYVMNALAYLEEICKEE